MFCSIACKEELYSKAVNMDGILCADIKLLSDVASYFGGVKQFDDYMKRTDLKTLNKTIFDYDLNDPNDPGYKDKLVNCFLSLSTNKDCTEYHRCIQSYISEKAANHLLSILNLNEKRLIFHDGFRNVIDIGHHISLFTSLMNHCCINNAFSFNIGKKVVTILEKPVKAGEQIFFRYG